MFTLQVSDLFFIVSATQNKKGMADCLALGSIETVRSEVAIPNP